MNALATLILNANEFTFVAILTIWVFILSCSEIIVTSNGFKDPVRCLFLNEPVVSCTLQVSVMILQAIEIPQIVEFPKLFSLVCFVAASKIFFGALFHIEVFIGCNHFSI
jgi:hypothetical protein